MQMTQEDVRIALRQVVDPELGQNLVDLPPGTADAPLTVMQVLPLDGVVLVTTPQDLAAMVVRKAVRMAQTMDVRLLGVVENMSYFVCPETGSRHEIFGPSQAGTLAHAAGVPLLARLPVDPQISRLCDAGEIEAYDDEHHHPRPEALRQRPLRGLFRRGPGPASSPLARSSAGRPGVRRPRYRSGPGQLGATS
ncbi:MAG: P-loop NTPase [Anaerolineae bacterium]